MISKFVKNSTIFFLKNGIFKENFVIHYVFKANFVLFANKIEQLITNNKKNTTNLTLFKFYSALMARTINQVDNFPTPIQQSNIRQNSLTTDVDLR